MNDMNVIECIIGICSTTRCLDCDFASRETLECVFDGSPYRWDATEILDILRTIEEDVRKMREDR